MSTNNATSGKSARGVPLDTSIVAAVGAAHVNRRMRTLLDPFAQE
ncbi:MAG TPA: hypothetical protein VL173_09565 [Vicinamibacterales bacterium]|nr:hypothetical protein [Vicinamibacterales bacterium]